MITARRVSYCALASAIRFLLMNSEFQKIISERVEVSTALNSWKRGKINFELCYLKNPIGIINCDICSYYVISN